MRLDLEVENVSLYVCMYFNLYNLEVCLHPAAYIIYCKLYFNFSSHSVHMSIRSAWLDLPLSVSLTVYPPSHGTFLFKQLPDFPPLAVAAWERQQLWNRCRSGSDWERNDSICLLVFSVSVFSPWHTLPTHKYSHGIHRHVYAWMHSFEQNTHKQNIFSFLCPFSYCSISTHHHHLFVSSSFFTSSSYPLCSSFLHVSLQDKQRHIQIAHEIIISQWNI